MPSAPTKKPAAAKPASKPQTAAAPRSKAAPSPESSPPSDAAPSAAKAASTTLRSRDLVARVAEARGAKAKDARAFVEATLAALGAALDAGETLNLPPLGKLWAVPAKSPTASGPMKLKLRRAGPEKNNDKEGLAEASEDS